MTVRPCIAGNFWSAMRTPLLVAAEEVVGYGGRVQPDWFQKSSGNLMPLIDVKNVCRQRMLQNNIPPLRRGFRKCQHAIKAVVDKARENWILKVANEESLQWECMKLLPVVTSLYRLILL